MFFFVLLNCAALVGSAIPTFQHKRIQPGTPLIPSVFQFFRAVFYSSLIYIYKALTSYT